MKRLAVYLKEYKKESILAPLFKLLEVVFDLIVPVVVAKMIDIGVAGKDRGYVFGCFAILLLMAAGGTRSILLKCADCSGCWRLSGLCSR